MSQQPKRLKKNISFSEHERDIYEYLDGIKNASALVKRLVYNHMILEQGLVVPTVATLDTNKQEQEQKNDTEQYETETPEGNESQQEPKVIDDLEDKIEELEEYINEQAITVEDEQSNKEPIVPVKFSKEDLQNKKILPDL